MHVERATLALVSAVALMTTLVAASSEARALDGYQRRAGVFGGVALGGGYGAWWNDDELEETGPGFQGQVVLGTGVSEWWTVGVEADWWTRTVSKSDANEYTFHHGNIGGVGNLYLTEWFYLNAGGGFAYGLCSGRFQGRDCGWQEFGFSAQGGLGVEVWFNGTVAGVANVDYTHHFYLHSTGFGSASALFGVRWY